MSFRFKPGETPQKTLKRVADAELAVALEVLKAPHDARTVHELRKQTKKLRGLLRLYQPVFPGFARENAALRDAARHLAALRDAEVRLATFDDLGLAAPSLRARLTEDLQRAGSDEAREAALASMARDLTAVRMRIGSWRLRGHGRGFDTIAPGLSQTLIQARKRMARSRRVLRAQGAEFDAAPFHEWRKSVKHHWYQMRLLLPVWPDMMAPHLTASDDLAETLGRHNDMDLLVVAMGRAGVPPDDLRALSEAALARRHVLARKALDDGARLFAGPPDALVERWRVWWTLWART